MGVGIVFIRSNATVFISSAREKKLEKVFHTFFDVFNRNILRIEVAKNKLLQKLL